MQKTPLLPFSVECASGPVKNGKYFNFDIDRAIRLSLLKAVSDTVLEMINAAYYDKPLVLIRTILSTVPRLFLTVYLTPGGGYMTCSRTGVCRRDFTNPPTYN